MVAFTGRELPVTRGPFAMLEAETLREQKTLDRERDLQQLEDDARRYEENHAAEPRSEW